MRENKLRQLLDADLPSLGTHVMSSWPSVIELVGNTGNYDCAYDLGEGRRMTPRYLLQRVHSHRDFPCCCRRGVRRRICPVRHVRAREHRACRGAVSSQ